MLKLTFKRNAVVRLGLLGFNEPKYVTGRITQVTADEVVIVQQGKLDSEISSKSEDIKYMSFDFDEELHIDRGLIFSWKYARIDQLPDLSLSEILEDSCKLHFDPQTNLYVGRGKEFEGVHVHEYDELLIDLHKE